MISPKLVLYAFTSVVVLIFTGVVIVYATLFYHVHKYFDNATKNHEGKCVDALISLAQNERESIRRRNDSIWALGQLADKKALSILKSMYKGVPDSREPLDKVISQYEIRKAIRWCSEGNWTSWMYRGY